MKGLARMHDLSADRFRDPSREPNLSAESFSPALRDLASMFEVDGSFAKKARPDGAKSRHSYRESTKADPILELKPLPIEERLEILSERLVDPAHLKKDSSLLARLPSLLCEADFDSKLDLLTAAISRTRGGTRERVALAILRSSSDLEELALLSHTSGLGEDPSIANPDLQEVLALAAIGPDVALAALPKPLSKHANRKAANNRLDEVRECILERVAACAMHLDLTATRTHKEFTMALLYSLHYLDEERKNAKTTGELRDLANLMIAKVGLECRYALCLTSEVDDEGHVTSPWRLKDVQDVRKAIKAIPENRVLFTPLLFRIERVERLGPGVLAMREPDGTISLADSTVGSRSLKERFRGISSLTSTLCHEIGHSLQIGGFVPQGSKLSAGDRSFRGPADLAYDFDRYMEISGWQTFGRKEYRIKDGGLSVVIGGKEHALDVPTEHEGQGVVFIYDEGDERLYAYPTAAKFSTGTYCRTSPWEDWAEAFAEYVLLPKRLIDFAPQKFAYFEEHLGKYAEDKRISAYYAKRSADA